MESEIAVSEYARYFDSSSPNWVRNQEINLMFVQCQQNYANHLLRARGHVFLNEIYDLLGLKRSSIGQSVGWFLEDANSEKFIDFGLNEDRNLIFMSGVSNTLLLDFNIDGVIYDKID